MTTLTFLGTGTSQGVPMIACPCEVCRSSDPRDARLRSSALVRTSGLDIAIDAGPDFRTQMLSADVQKLDAILMTHEHKDHTGGLDDIRAFNYFTSAPVDVWATEHVAEALRRDYAYAFDENPYPGAPEITLHTIDDGRDPDGRIVREAKPFNVKGVDVLPIRGWHRDLPVTGFRFDRVAYLTDFNRIDESELDNLKGLDVLVINALGHKAHISHFNLEQATEIAQKVGAKETYFTHISHRMGLFEAIEPTLPAGIHLACDGLTV